MTPRPRTLLAALIGSLLACGGERGATVGEETGNCYANGTCNQGLSCFSNRCVRFEADGSGDSSGGGGVARTDANGSNGGSAAGGGGAGGGAESSPPQGGGTAGG